jgi:putative phosphoesterase
LTRIGLLSDTHGFLDEAILSHFENCQEIWHAGDFGPDVAEPLRAFRPLMGVFGNIDGREIRNEFPENLIFRCERVNVMMRHIGGYPPRYNPETKTLLEQHQPKIFISGHSHILKVMFDKERNCLHMNPGAAGKQGWHRIRTCIRFVIDGEYIRDCEVIELGSR